jgi:uncharacterized protein YecE (DUF72 family)
LKQLPGEYRYAFEFRDSSWFDTGVYEALTRQGAALCMYDLKGKLSSKEVTADFIYVRLHGPSSEAYRGKYDRQALAGWAGAFSTWMKQGKEIYCYFDNDEAGYAAQNARELQEMVSGFCK